MKHPVRTATVLGTILIALACGPGADKPAGDASADAAVEPLQIVAPLEPLGGSGVTGTATFTQDRDKVRLHVAIANATPGSHAFHLHEVGDCSAPDGSSAGGHWNPTGSDHGRWGHGAFHLGDVGNIEVGDDGQGHLELVSELWAIGGGGQNDITGKALIVHEVADDFTTQPTGAAGGRIACGVIR